MTPLLSLAWALAVLLQSSTAGEPGALIAAATRAVEHDSAAIVSAAWKAQLRRRPGDRTALLGLATIARLTYDYVRAESLYAPLLAPAGTCPTPHAIYGRIGQALAFTAVGAFPRANEWFARAAIEADVAGDPIAEAEALLGGAVARTRTEGAPAAERLLAHAARLIPARNTALWAAYHLARAQLLVLSSRPRAYREAELAAVLAARAGDQYIHAGGLHLMAADLVRRGESDSALALYAKAIRERERARDRAGLATSLQWRGFLLRTMGAYGEARRDLSRAVTEGEVSHNNSAMAWALTNLGSISLVAGDVAGAARDADRAAALFATQGDRYGLAVSRELRGGIDAALGNIAEARTAFQGALSRYEAGRFAAGVYTAHVSLAHLAMRQHDWVSAHRELEGAKAGAKRYGMRGVGAELAYTFGALALRRGALPAAARALRAALAQSTRTQAALRYATRMRLAELFGRTGELARAEHELTAAVDRFDDWRAALSDRQLRLGAFQLAPDESEPNVGVASVIARLASAGRLNTAFHAAEWLHARALFDEMSRAEALWERPDHADRASTNPWHSHRGVSMDQVADALPDAATGLLEFVGGSGEPTTVFVVGRRLRSAVVLPPDDALAPAVARFNVLVESGLDPRGLGRALGAALLDSVVRRLPTGIARLIIIPDGALHRLAFDALVTADGRYVVERFAVSVVPSAAIALRLWRRPPQPGETRLLALADPTVAPAPVNGQTPIIPGFSLTLPDRGALGHLPAAAEEVIGAARYASVATVLLGKAASASWLKHHSLTPYRIIHFATHAVVDDAVMNRTALALAPGEGENGFLGPADLAHLRLAADLVVLSGCRTAGGVVFQGEGLQGLTAPLLEAGAKAVVVTWWPIGDRGALPIVDGLYRSLAAGRPITVALQRAKLAALRSGAPAREWASFTLAGDPLVRVPLHLPSQPGERVSVLTVFGQPR
jgi:tetratricopeptide (TPR) repeat protein